MNSERVSVFAFQNSSTGLVEDAHSPALTPDDESFRAKCYSEALAAISTYINEDLVAPPSAKTLEFLGVAWGRMTSERRGFGPEDFTLFAMSMLPHDADSDGEEQRVRRGAMRYLLDVKPRLSPEFQSLAGEARAVLRGAREPLQGRGVVGGGPVVAPLSEPTDSAIEVAEPAVLLTTRPPATTGRDHNSGSDAPYRRLTLRVPDSETLVVPDPGGRQKARPSTGKASSGAVMALLFSLTVLIALAIFFTLMLFLPA